MTKKRFGFEMDKNCYKCIADRVEKKLYTDKKQVINELIRYMESNFPDFKNNRYLYLLDRNKKIVAELYRLREKQDLLEKELEENTKKMSGKR